MILRKVELLHPDGSSRPHEALVVEAGEIEATLVGSVT